MYIKFFLFLGQNNGYSTESSHNNQHNYGSHSLGTSTGLYDPYRPDGPDFNKAITGSSSSQSSISSMGNFVDKMDGGNPVKIGVDLYPMSPSSSSNSRYGDQQQGTNKQQVLLHLNLMPQKSNGDNQYQG